MVAFMGNGETMKNRRPLHREMSRRRRAERRETIREYAAMVFCFVAGGALLSIVCAAAVLRLAN